MKNIKIFASNTHGYKKNNVFFAVKNIKTLKNIKNALDIHVLTW